MTLRLRGIAAVAEAHVHQHPEGRVYLRRCLPTKLEVPLYFHAEGQYQATSIYVTLERLGGYLTAEAKLFTDDDESELLYDLIVGGQHALGLMTMDEEGYYKGAEFGYRIESMKIVGVTLDYLCSCEHCFAWVQEDDHIAYQIPKDLFIAVQEFHEVSGKPEPIVDHIPNSFAAADQVDPPHERPQAPVEGDNISFMKLVRSQGEVDLLISDQGTLVSKVRAGPALIESLREMLESYDNFFPNPICEADYGDES